MTCRILELGAAPQFVGRAVCAIGVFDGVHTGHQELVRRAVALAREEGVGTFVVTFDRDPDQIITPESAAPQLLTLDAKARLLCAAGADAVLVVRFTSEVAALSPSEFLSEILLSAIDPVAVIVGQDFRFGHQAVGTVDTLRRYAEPRGIHVVAHELVEIDGVPVTSTRIRALVAQGDMRGAAALLGRPHRVHGIVVRGRGEGTGIGVPTANVSPAPYAALPAPGVYAGRVEVAGRLWPAAISVGRPPTFPQAVDVLEAHLVGFEGDLYDAEVSVEFIEKLRDQRRFDSVAELSCAMKADIEVAARIGASATGELVKEPDAADQASARDWDENPLLGLAESFFDTLTLGATDDDPEFLDDGSPVIEDPVALEAAERAVAGGSAMDAYADYDEDWVEVLGPTSLGNLMSSGAIGAFVVTSPLRAAGIPFVWQPFPPEEQQNVRPDFNFWMRFSLHVPPEHAHEARRLLGVSGLDA